MPAPPPQLLWIDPGGMTGMAWLMKAGDSYHPGCYEYPWDEACRNLDIWCQDWRGRLHLGYERFTILPSTHKMSPQPEAYELPGVIKHLARKYNCVLLEPAQPSDRLTVSQADLEALHLWLPGKDDAQSAARHLVAWMKREKCLPPDWAKVLATVR